MYTQSRGIVFIALFVQTWVLGENSTVSTPLSRVTRTTYSYKNKEITHYILICSSCYTLIFKVYSFFIELRTLASWGVCSLSGSELSRWSRSPPATFTFFYYRRFLLTCMLLRQSSSFLHLLGRMFPFYQSVSSSSRTVSKAHIIYTN